MAFVNKQVLGKNLEERIRFGEEYQGKTIEDFWSCITYTDKAYHDPSTQPISFILRQEGGSQ